jgi:hypothetical protein
MATPINPFIDHYLPEGFWNAQIATFGRDVTWLPQGDAAQAFQVRVLWKEGQTDEEVSPGRYSHMDVQNTDFPLVPQLRDLVLSGGKEYQVVRIQALAVRFAVIVVQDNGVL